MGWLHEHGLISSYDDYLSLPAGVLEDARELMVGEAFKRQRDQANQGGARRGRR